MGKSRAVAAIDGEETSVRLADGRVRCHMSLCRRPAMLTSMPCFLTSIEALLMPSYDASALDKHGDFMLALAEKALEVAETVPTSVSSSRTTHML